ncbi:hypothetical protein O6P43_018816 [Quillaja saponaria]|uniref:Uncharacterized protein n=1 Tax=Quillaja saponaria TaxID=32244 RepID=A0AAD7LJ88_QUISA|nr:hypothetical protein O6P43_018816 [Quillaja saponaria]
MNSIYREDARVRIKNRHADKGKFLYSLACIINKPGRIPFRDTAVYCFNEWLSENHWWDVEDKSQRLKIFHNIVETFGKRKIPKMCFPVWLGVASVILREECRHGLVSLAGLANLDVGETRRLIKGLFDMRKELVADKLALLGIQEALLIITVKLSSLGLSDLAGLCQYCPFYVGGGKEINSLEPNKNLITKVLLLLVEFCLNKDPDATRLLLCKMENLTCHYKRSWDETDDLMQWMVGPLLLRVLVSCVDEYVPYVTSILTQICIEDNRLIGQLSSELPSQLKDEFLGNTRVLSFFVEVCNKYGSNMIDSGFLTDAVNRFICQGHVVSACKLLLKYLEFYPNNLDLAEFCSAELPRLLDVLRGESQAYSELEEHIKKLTCWENAFRRKRSQNQMN